ncbi:hypothetical protein POJ06DRAFT_43761 [Lipomyces tetrasporus]|uniref:Secreted protein n=1 Tax=Lipomyces tetrasporus TaxID=54092 RepID=A0AAD7QK79_9ASCO|nr:uncharacterized protein POJ06DRAFT_43761 [Lipomyces tetrasporus]KAJ8096754.1 hypothetical protein POJ06DRAFT_43761 [Lipomyces tetrasporus]
MTLFKIWMLAVLDCCNAGSAVWAGSNRSVQLLARCDERHTVRSRTDGVTLPPGDVRTKECWKLVHQC